MNKIICYCDGACSGNPGIGGWAALIFDYKMNLIDKKSGGELYTTNNRMELTAAINAAQYNHKDIDIYIDSMYVKNGITSWIHNWKKNNWIGSNKRIIKNQDLWVTLDTENIIKNINWYWVKGHSSDRYNAFADQEATKALSLMRDSNK